MPLPLALWKQIQRTNFTDRNKLLAFLKLKEEQAPAPSSFPLNLPYRLAAKIEKGNWNDPILRQFLPIHEEEMTSSLFSSDPISETSFRKTDKLLHKYKGRALLLATSACTMNCRYCFRRHFDYAPQKQGFEAELNAIREDTTLSEVLLSGGDPLSLSEHLLGALLKEIDQIPHLQRIRFHTRFPIGIPERIDETLLSQLRSCSKQVIFIIHTNHPRELDDQIFFHLKQIQALGIPVLTQSVLLKGVNDCPNTLETLFSLLINEGILPYYLHQLDRVQGAAHFEVSEERGLEIIDDLRTRLPGYAIPQYVREEAHCPSKTVITFSSKF